jgi:hypothetical protein
MTSAELAKQFNVTRRTAQRWIKAGAPVEDTARMAIWIDEHQSHFGRSKFMSGEPAKATYGPAAPPSLELTAADYDFTSTDKLIGNLSSLAGRAMHDLEAARLTGSGPAVARASKIFNDAVHQLRQSLISRDQLQASAGASYSPAEISWAFAQIFVTLRYMLTEALPRAAEQDAWDAGIVDLKNRIVLEGIIRDAVRLTVLPSFSESGAHFSAIMTENRNVSTLRQREELFNAIKRAWNPDMPEPARPENEK